MCMLDDYLGYKDRDHKKKLIKEKRDGIVLLSIEC